MTVWFSATAAAPCDRSRVRARRLGARVADHGRSGRIRRRHAGHRRSPTPPTSINPRRLFRWRAASPARRATRRSRVAAERRRHHRPALLHGCGARVGLSARHEDRRGVVSRAARHRARRRGGCAHASAPRFRTCWRGSVPVCRGGRLSYASSDPGGWPADASSRFGVKDGPHVSASAPFDRHALRIVLREPRHAAGDARLLRAHVGALRDRGHGSRRLPARRSALAARRPSDPLVAFVTIASGSIGCVVAGLWADRVGQGLGLPAPPCSPAPPARCSRRSSIGALARRAAGARRRSGDSPSSPTPRSSPRWSPSTAPRTHVGTALTLQTSAGFLLTMVSMRMVPEIAAAPRLARRIPGPRPGPDPRRVRDAGAISKSMVEGRRSKSTPDFVTAELPYRHQRNRRLLVARDRDLRGELFGGRSEALCGG